MINPYIGIYAGSPCKVKINIYLFIYFYNEYMYTSLRKKDDILHGINQWTPCSVNISSSFYISTEANI